MTLFLFFKGLLLGLAIAAPVGPIGALCINRTLARGFLAGVAGGLGTALADGAYALMAAAGFAIFASVLAVVSIPLGLLGGLFLLWLGYQGFKPRGPVTAREAAPGDLWKTTLATFLLTIANPATIMSFAAIFAGLGLAHSADTLSALLLVAGVFAGSMLWWILLSAAVSLLQARLPDSFATIVSRVSAVIMVGFGVFAIASAALALVGTGSPA